MHTMMHENFIVGAGCATGAACVVVSGYEAVHRNELRPLTWLWQRGNVT